MGTFNLTRLLLDMNEVEFDSAALIHGGDYSDKPTPIGWEVEVNAHLITSLVDCEADMSRTFFAEMKTEDATMLSGTVVLQKSLTFADEDATKYRYELLGFSPLVVVADMSDDGVREFKRGDSW